MKKIEQTRTPEELKKLGAVEFHDLWFNQALTSKQMAKMFGVERRDVEARRKELKLTAWNCAILSLIGGDKYKGKKKRS